MNRNIIIMILLAVIFGVGAVFASNMWLTGQRAYVASMAGDRAPQQTIVVASKPLRFGDRLTADNLREIPWTAGDRPAGSFKTREDLLGSDEKGREVLTAMSVNEPILEWKITGPGQRATLSAVLTDGMRAVSIRVNDVLGVAGFVLPGDRVDILLSRNRNDNEGNAFVDVLLQSIKVLAIDQVADDTRDDPAVVRTVTLEVTTEDAQKLTLAAGIGQLSLALRKIASGEGQMTRRITMADLVGDTPDDVARRAEEAEKRLEEERARFAEALTSLREAVETSDSRLEERIAEMASQMNAARDVPAAAPEVREVVVYKDPPKPVNVSVGVIRDLKRDVYEVPSEGRAAEALN